MTHAFLLCLSIAVGPPDLPGDAVLRGCALAHASRDVVAPHVPPPLLLAIAWRESRFREVVNASGHHGPWQLDAALCEDCEPPAQAATAAWLLERFLRNGRPLRDALRKYSGSRPGSTWYAREVLELADAWTVR